jgi:LysM repeat protein
VQAGGGSNGQDGRGDRNPPDEGQMRIGRSRVSRGFDPTDEERPLDGAGAPGGLIGGTAPAAQPFAQASRPAAQTQGPSDAIDLSPRFRAWSEPGPAGAGPMRCHFLRTVGPDGRLAEAQRTAVPTHRCAAFGDPLPLSLRQQELVCLQRVHVSCPRYVRGTLLANENQAQPELHERREGGVPLWTIAGVALVILSLLIFSSALLGIGPLGGGGSQPSHIAAGSPSASRSATAAPTPTATPTVRVTPTATASATATASPTPAGSPTWTPNPSPTWPPGATASRMDLLVPCTDQPNCWVYTVHGAGPPPSGNGSPVADTLAGIIKFFGVSMASVQKLNTWLNGGSAIKPGDKLKIPTPTKWA